MNDLGSFLPSLKVVDIDRSARFQIRNAFEARDINNSGQIVGAGWFAGEERAYLLSPSPMPEPCPLALLAVGIMPLVGSRP